MLCYTCGHDTTDQRRITMPHPDVPHTVLENIRIHECPDCGGRTISYERRSQFERVLAESIICHRARLDGERLRFLREFLELTQEQLGAMIGVQAVTVSRWERNTQDPSVTADRLIRFTVADALHLDDFRDALEQVALLAAEEWSLRLRFEPDTGWHSVEPETSASTSATTR